jgi:hypothetical protein
MSTKDELPSIDLTALSQVTGGARATATSGSGDDQVLTALTGILDTLTSTSKCSSGGFNQQEMFLLMMLMQQRSQHQVAIAAPTSWPPQPVIRYY